MRGLQAVVVEDGPVEEQAIVLNWNNTIFDPHDEGRYGSLEIGVATTERPGLMSTADKAALGAASAASAEIPQIKQTIEDNELTIAAALNDLNSRLLELVARVDALDGGGDTPEETQYIKVTGQFADGDLFGYIEDNHFVVIGPSEENAYLIDSQDKIVSSVNISSTSAEEIVAVINAAYPEVGYLTYEIKTYSVGDKINIGGEV